MILAMKGLPLVEPDNLYTDYDEHWKALMNKEGLRFSYLKRRMLLYEEIPGAWDGQNGMWWFPIPLNALIQNPNLVQNPGW